ncbi:MAG: T9SS type A sorting domain-containing protein, partial [Flavobacterium sp.]|nr:T9SS type A sorting domain-containing protein [Flavobacterium sp.]
MPTSQFGYGIPDFQLALSNALSTSLFENNTILIYPNPVQDELSIVLPESEVTGKLILYNNLGQLVNEFTLSETNKTVYLSNLASGLYFYQINTTHKSTKGKLLKL